MTERKKSRPERSESPEPRQTFGAGYLYHFDPEYQQFAERFEKVGGNVDLYEVLGVQFNSEPDRLETFAESLGKPITLHSYEYCLGNVSRPPKNVIDRIQELARRCKAAYIGEHMAIMGTSDFYCGGFLQPPGTEEQTEILVRNLAEAKRHSVCPIIIENPSQFYRQVGPHSIGRQLRDMVEQTDSGLLLSLSNISISERFRPQDREAFLGELPMGRVRQIHVLCNNQAEERMPGMEKARAEQAWALAMLEQLSKNEEVKPASVIFELEAGTRSRAEPERLRDFIDMARSLFFPK